MLHDPQRAGEVLADLRALGVGLALDDFGTGYSSLEHLKRLPVDELKIDKSFVMSMDRDAADRAIVASTVALGRSLGLRVVAEGVESAASASVLAAIGCDLAQGFHYSPPVPADQIPGLVARRARIAQIGVGRRHRRLTTYASKWSYALMWALQEGAGSPRSHNRGGTHCHGASGSGGRLRRHADVSRRPRSRTAAEGTSHRGIPAPSASSRTSRSRTSSAPARAAADRDAQRRHARGLLARLSPSRSTTSSRRCATRATTRRSRSSTIRSGKRRSRPS